MTASPSLPNSWSLARLGDLGEWGSGGTPLRSNPSFYDGEIPWLKIGDLTDGPIWSSETSITRLGLASSSAKLLEPGAVLLAMYGSIGKLGINKIECATNQAIAFCRHDPRLITREYLFHGLSLLKPTFLALGQGGTQQNISQTLLKEVLLPIAPLPEQHRIVEKIEVLSAQLDKGEEALRAVQKQLTRYRQSVLKAAVTGQLTADWRVENAHRIEQGHDLLARILQTRRETWDGRGKYKEPAAPDAADLPELPEGWAAARFEQLFQVFGGATPSRARPEYWNGELPWVSSGEVAFCRIRETSEKITQTGYSSCSTKLHPPGTVLLAMIGEGKTRGQAAILEIEACNNQNAAAIRVAGTGIPSEYLYYFLMANYEESRSKGQGGNQPALNGEKVKGFVLPVPSREEMNEIVARIDAAFSTADTVERWCETELARSASLRQSILKDAFAGRLVTQDPTDEPAAELLARIKSRNRPAARKTRRVTA